MDQVLSFAPTGFCKGVRQDLIDEFIKLNDGISDVCSEIAQGISSS